MADPEQIYQEVLSEEQGKGVSPAVAEGRAKAARVRAEHGSPHPKEAKWWPGGQPHLEGAEAAPAEAAAAPAEAAAAPAEAEAAPAEAEAAEAPAPEPEPAGAEAAAADQPVAEAPPAPEAPATTGGVQAPPVPQEQAQAPAAAAPERAEEAAAAAAAEPAARPAGVTHGTTTGTRVRPEDAVTTEAQLQGQEAMYERRRLIDELIATGVPATAASEAGERRSPMLALLYLLIPLLAIALVLAQNDTAGSGGDGGPPPPEEEGLMITAANVAFDTDELTLPAGEESTIEFVNEDSVQHNVAIYETEAAERDLFVGRIIDPGETTYEVPALDEGEYFFRCDVHPTAMTGTVIVE